MNSIKINSSTKHFIKQNTLEELILKALIRKHQRNTSTKYILKKPTKKIPNYSYKPNLIKV